MRTPYVSNVQHASEGLALATLGEKLNELRVRSGRTLQAVAEIGDYRGRSSVQKYFSAEYDPPFLDMSIAMRLARSLVGQGNPPVSEDELFSLTGSRENKVGQFSYAEISSLKRDVPVYICVFVSTKIIMGSESPVNIYGLDLDNPMEYCWHPPTLINRDRIFALRIERVPLLPRYRPGEYIFVDQQATIRFGDEILITLSKIESEQDGNPVEQALVLFGTLENQLGTKMQVRTLDGTDVFSVDSAKHIEIFKLISLHDALVP